MSWRWYIVPHEAPLSARQMAVADVITRPSLPIPEFSALALRWRYHHPMRVFVAPGQTQSAQVQRLKALWRHHAPGMHYTVEVLAALVEPQETSDGLR